MSATKRISLANELDEVTNALDAARLLADDLYNEQLGTEADTRHAPKMIAAVVNLAVARMNIVGRVLRGLVDPRLIWELFNDASGLDPDSQEEDVVVVAEWDVGQRIAHAEAELHRMKRRQSRRPTESES